MFDGAMMMVVIEMMAIPCWILFDRTQYDTMHTIKNTYA
jgi:hypothetical protein